MLQTWAAEKGNRGHARRRYSAAQTSMTTLGRGGPRSGPVAAAKAQRSGHLTTGVGLHVVGALTRIVLLPGNTPTFSFPGPT